MREQVGRRRNWPVGELSLEIQKLVGYLFSGECVKHKHDQPSEIEVGGTDTSSSRYSRIKSGESVTGGEDELSQQGHGSDGYPRR